VKAATQDRKILEFYLIYRGVMFTPSQVHAAIFSDDVPVTSIRRSMTNLSDSGMLEKTDKVMVGPYGRNEHFWRLRG
jgi:hypothetical protein